MKTVITYGTNRFVVEEMTPADWKKLKKDKPELYNKFKNK